MKTFPLKFNDILLLQSIKRLTEILLKENICLEKMDLSTIDKYLEEKLALTLYMSEAKKILVENPYIKEQLQTSRLNEISEAYKAFEKILSQNSLLVSYCKAANQRVMDALIKAQNRSITTITYDKKCQKKEGLVTLNFLQKI